MQLFFVEGAKCMSETRRVYKIKKTKKKRKRKIILFLTIVFMLFLGATAYGANLYLKAQEVFNHSFKAVDASAKRDKAVNPLKDNFTMLFIGVDDSAHRNQNGHARSDALILATFNNEHKSIKLLSIPRDSYVYIPMKGFSTKINAAHAYGGPKATMDTIENLLDIPVDYYVSMNFNAFTEVVDALGGIEAKVPYAITESDSSDHKNAIHLEPGLQTLNGEQALALARTRHQDSDIQRGQRQQMILKAILNKATSVGAVTKYTSVIEAVGNNMTTNLPFSDLKGFINYMTTDKGIKIDTVKLKGSDSYINGVYYYQLDQTSVEEVKNALKAQLDLLTTASNQSTTTSVQN